MLFNSMDFAFFLAGVAAAYVLCPARLRWLLLLCASYGFYMSWNPRYAFLLVTSTTVAYLCALLMARAPSPGRRRLLLGICLAGNLSLLFAFKYANFVFESLDAAVLVLGLRLRLPSVDVLLPVGISFYTFQTLGYAIDVYRGGLQPEPHFGRFALFASFFPQLIAGPIGRARNLLPQLSRLKAIDPSLARSGLDLVLWGLFKKVVVADRCGLEVDRVYQSLDLASGPELAFAVYLFAIQIYCDFSGYSDMAIGTARIFGVNLMQNFRLPFFAKTMGEFWQRWHISLMTWLRDYVYLPIALRRRDPTWSYFSIMVLMTASGLWHGAAWTFVIWGVVHGVMIASSRATLSLRDRAYRAARVPAPLVAIVRTLVTFHLFCLSMVLFRAPEISDAVYLFTHLGTGWGVINLPVTVFPGCIALLAIELVWFLRTDWFERSEWPWALCWAARLAAIFAILLIGVDQSTQFIYAQF